METNESEFMGKLDGKWRSLALFGTNGNYECQDWIMGNLFGSPAQNAIYFIPASVSLRVARTLLKRLLSKNKNLTHNLHMLLDSQEQRRR